MGYYTNSQKEPNEIIYVELPDDDYEYGFIPEVIDFLNLGSEDFDDLDDYIHYVEYKAKHKAKREAEDESKSKDPTPRNSRNLYKEWRNK